MEARYGLLEADRKDELLYLQLEGAKKTEEVKLSTDLYRTTKAELDVKSKEVLSLQSRLAVMDGEFRNLREQEGQAIASDVQFEQMQNRLK